MTQIIPISNIAHVQCGQYPGKARFRSRPQKGRRKRLFVRALFRYHHAQCRAPGRVRQKGQHEEGGMGGVKRERDDSVGGLTLDEPASLNAMTPDLLGDLGLAIPEMTADPQVRALVLTGAGRGFCSGQNLKAAQILGDDIVEGVMRYYWPTFKALRECRVPIVVAVNGVAAGGGFSLAMAGDMIVAARSAKFLQGFSRIALVPDLGST